MVASSRSRIAIYVICFTSVSNNISSPLERHACFVTQLNSFQAMNPSIPLSQYAYIMLYNYRALNSNLKAIKCEPRPSPLEVYAFILCNLFYKTQTCLDSTCLITHRLDQAPSLFASAPSESLWFHHHQILLFQLQAPKRILNKCLPLLPVFQQQQQLSNPSYCGDNRRVPKFNSAYFSHPGLYRSRLLIPNGV